MHRGKPSSPVLIPVLAASVLVVATGFASRPAAANPAQFPRPPQLEPDVKFWQRVYSKVTTQSGYLHDDRYLDLVYEQIDFAPGLSGRERAEIVDAARARYERILNKLASGARDNLSPDEQRVLSLFPSNVSSAALSDAADRVRFQLGQGDRFREGLVRAGIWERHVEETLRKEGLPGELSALPHVESSFNPRAYSKVGAAGMWQFMPSTGRRWLRIDNVVDERLDPYKSTVAAAQFLNINYSFLGTWPLALTAYNHGAAGMNRAKEQMGTDDITTIVRGYQSRTFGFASRNFYVSFLAALEIDRNVDRFFGSIDRLPPDSSRTIRLPHYVPVSAIERAFGTDRDTLRNLNIALMGPVWSGQRFIPQGFDLRVPAGSDPERALAKLGLADRYAAQQRDATHRVRKGETLDRVALSYGVKASELAAYNHLTSHQLKPGTTLKLPPVQPVAATAAPAPAVAAAEPESEAGTGELYVVKSGDSLSTIARRYGLAESALMAQNGIKDRNFLFEGQKLRVSKNAAAPAAAEAPAEPEAESAPRPRAESARAKPQPASREEAAAQSPALVPGIDSAASPDPSDYSVSGDTVTVQGAETLGHFAEWLGVSADHLRKLNHMGPDAVLGLGHKIHVDLSRVSAASFEEQRTRFHHALQDEFFAHYRIAGQEKYRLKSGESLWTLTQRTSVPIWLLRQYNPDTDFGAMRIGMQIMLPRVEPIAPQAQPPGSHE